MKDNILKIYKIAFDSTLDSIICSDESNLVTLINPAAEKMFGYSEKELVGKAVSILLPEEYRERHNNGLKKYIKTRKPQMIGKTIEVTGLKKNGNVFPVELTVSVNQDDKLIFTAMLRDITIRKQKEKLDIENIKLSESKKSALKLNNSLIQAIEAIALTQERRDPYTAGHMNRVAELSEAIGKKLDLSEERIVGIKLGGRIHDIGKIHIPSAILNRPGKLTDAEFEIIKSHPQVGHEIIKGINFPWPIADMILSHHERLDGSGYPNAKKGNDFTLEAQIIAVADVVEAVSSHRPYRAALGIDKGLEIIIEHKGSWYNSEVVNACLEIIQKEGFKFTTNF